MSRWLALNPPALIPDAPTANIMYRMQVVTLISLLPFSSERRRRKVAGTREARACEKRGVFL